MSCRLWFRRILAALAGRVLGGDPGRAMRVIAQVLDVLWTGEYPPPNDDTTPAPNPDIPGDTPEKWLIQNLENAIVFLGGHWTPPNQEKTDMATRTDETLPHPAGKGKEQQVWAVHVEHGDHVQDASAWFVSQTDADRFATLAAAVVQPATIAVL